MMRWRPNLAGLVSIALLLVAWQVASGFAGARLLPPPASVAAAMAEAIRSGDLPRQMAATLLRVVASFTLAMSFGSAIGYLMGRRPLLDRLADPWIILLLNLPALVVIIMAYVWFGLTEAAAIGAVAVNKLPNTVVLVREGARALDPGLDEMARAFRLRAGARLREVVLPQLAPALAGAARSGLALVWKIVLVVELLGRPNGIGFALNTYFQLFDMRMLLAYALAFVIVMLAAETFLIQPLERRACRWRPRPA